MRRQRRALEREEKKKQKQQKKPKRLSNKVGESSTSSSGLQREEISSDECAVCLGAYQDDFNENGELVREWLQCTSDSCVKWMHQDCLIGDNDVYTCGIICGNFLLGSVRVLYIIEVQIFHS